jgi:MarR family transcriptional regulator, transcriptional regulator for hemolysin
VRAILACVQSSAAEKQATAEELARDLTALMKLLLVTSSRDFFVELEKAGISLTQIKSLTMLAERDEPLSVKALSDLMGLSLPGISRAVEGLVQRGEITRVEDAEDRRRKLLSITPSGRRTYERLLATRIAGVRRFVDELDPEEQEALSRGLRALAGRLDR